MDEPSQNNADTLCDVCGSHTRVPGYGQQFGTLLALWGYGSKHDSERYRVHLCESCFFQTLAYLQEQRRIHAMYDDDQPPDIQAFGQIAVDDFFSDS